MISQFFPKIMATLHLGAKKAKQNKGHRFAAQRLRTTGLVLHSSTMTVAPLSPSSLYTKGGIMCSIKRDDFF